MKETNFNTKRFWIAYVLLILLFLVLFSPALGMAGSALLLFGMVMPIPFFIMGMMANKRKWSLLYALLVILIGCILMLIVFPLFGNLIQP